jgi:hypothetical protein
VCRYGGARRDDVGLDAAIRRRPNAGEVGQALEALARQCVSCNPHLQHLQQRDCRDPRAARQLQSQSDPRNHSATCLQYSVAQAHKHTCPLVSAANIGLAELRGRDADGTLIVGGSKPGVGSSGFMRMKPVFSVLLMNTATAPAACALTTCTGTRPSILPHGGERAKHEQLLGMQWMVLARAFSSFRCTAVQSLTFAWKEQLPRSMMTALPAKAVGRLNGVQPSAGSALTRDSGAEAVELTSAAIDGPNLACMIVYDCPSAPPPCMQPNGGCSMGLMTLKAGLPA